MARRPSTHARSRHWLLWLVLVLMVAGGVYYLITLPDPSMLQRVAPDYTALMTLRLEQAQADGRKLKIRKIWVPLKQISPLLKEAVRVSEDATFYSHDGFDLDEIEDALKQSMREQRMVRGASTISQQLIKNLYLSPTKNPLRKITEAILTYRLEQSVDKNRIFELYLNSIEWGDGIFGIEAAARRWFEETAFTLSPAQAVLLAAMLPMPLRVDPRAPSKWLKWRAKRILADLKALGRISEPELAEATSALQ